MNYCNTITYFRLLLVCITISSCSYAGYLKDPFEDIPNFYQVDDVLYRGGVPDRAGFEKLKALGVKTVIDLRAGSSSRDKGDAVAGELGLTVVNIPMSVKKTPSDKDMLKFLRVVTSEDAQPVFVFCSNGRDRTGAVVAMYRVVVASWAIKESYNEAKSLGFWPYHGDAELKRFIHQLKDKDEYFKVVGRETP